MYEITDRTIQKAILNDDYKNDIPDNTEQTTIKCSQLNKYLRDIDKSYYF